MVNVTLEKLKNDESVEYTMTFNSFTAWGGSAEFPVIANPIPRETAEGQILLKIMGNSTASKFSWIMKDKAVGVVTDDMGAEIVTTRTVPEQIEFWLKFMRPQFIDESYRLTINFTTPRVFIGVVSQFKWDMVWGESVTARCSLQFMEGTVIANGTRETDTPSPPLGVTASSPLAGQLQQTWLASENIGTSAIINWLFEYIKVGNQSVISEVIAPATFTFTKTGLLAGTYLCNVVGKNDSGRGLASPIIEVVVA